MPGRGGRIDIHSGSPTGPLVGTAQVQPPAATPGQRGPQWQEVTAAIRNPGSIADLYFVFHNDQEKEKNLMILDWVRFSKL